ncbi:MAG: DNA replication protein DnaD, partial [Eubacterium sp.]|nr:DNA replication protein DnaD [Eubacterium sp.]
MSTLSIRDHRLAGAITLPDEFVDYYMPGANGDFVKIYLYLLRSVHARTAVPTVSSMADVFRLTEGDIRRALSYWQDAGLLEL